VACFVVEPACRVGDEPPAEGLGKRLDPELSLTDEALPYLAEAIAGNYPDPT